MKLRPNTRLAVIAMTLFAGTAISAGIYQVSKRHEIIRLGYELTETSRDLRMLEEENRRLHLEISVLTNPQRIEGLARSLGMQRPLPSQIRSIGTPAEEDTP